MERGFYSPELRRRVVVKPLTALAMTRCYAVEENLSRRNEEAALMGVLLETLRGGMVDPALNTNTDLIDFARRNPKTAYRAFRAIRDMTI